MSQSPHKHVRESAKRCENMDKAHLDLVGPLSGKSVHTIVPITSVHTTSI